MDFATARDLGASENEADLRHYLCFGHRPLEGGNFGFYFDTNEVEALAWWTEFKRSRYYNDWHLWIASAIRGVR